MLSKEKLERLYLKEKLSLVKIATQTGVSVPTIANWMKKYGMERHSISQALTGRKLSKAHTEKVKKNIQKANQERSKNGVSLQERERLREIARARKGYKHSSETKEKISKTHQGKKINETAKKMSEARKKFKGLKHPLYGVERLDIKGENNSNWNGGVTSLYKQIRATIQYKQWRQPCFERDNWTCQVCCKKGGELHVDHIKTFLSIVNENILQTVKQANSCKKLWEVSNGRTLCVKCHRKTDTYGRPRLNGSKEG